MTRNVRTPSLKRKTYKLFDGGGLYLEVMPAGGKLWRLKYRFGSKEKRLSFEGYPIISLKDARDKRDDAKLLLASNVDPAISKQEEKITSHINASNIVFPLFNNEEMLYIFAYEQNIQQRLS
jgi:hypothetical protein